MLVPISKINSHNGFNGVLIKHIIFCIDSGTQLSMFSGSVQLCGNKLAVICFRPGGSFSANFCQMFIATVSNRSIIPRPPA